jgi:hypothetical protein
MEGRETQNPKYEARSFGFAQDVNPKQIRNSNAQMIKKKGESRIVAGSAATAAISVFNSAKPATL